MKKQTMIKYTELYSEVYLEIGDYEYECIIDTHIHHCPKCKHAIIPNLLGMEEFYDVSKSYYKICTTLYCPNCFNSFIAQYSFPNGLDDTECNHAKLDFFGPKSQSEEKFSKIIEEISPDFIRFYNQALAAEQMDLTDIAGPGYRKALEFLVKDFAIKNYPDKKEKIEDASLSQCINNYLDNPNMIKVAHAATWVGNDQVHYKQKHIDRNIDDLKTFIKVALSYIEFTERTNDAIAFTTK
ncbi:hypothetical protein COJ48_24870 [Bacillus cereus]|nr:hypothetical protein COJ48_24870 [Bacillus cereus]PGP86678.1 hypothetical protein CN997_05980 [Bacillus cereus]